MAKKTEDDQEVAALLTIKRPGLMTPKSRRDIAKWLRRQADMLLKDGKDYSETRYRARYYSILK